MCILFATGLGSNPSIATIMNKGIGFFINSIISSATYNATADFIRTQRGNDFMKILLLVGLGVGCGDMV